MRAAVGERFWRHVSGMRGGLVGLFVMCAKNNLHTTLNIGVSPERHVTCRHTKNKSINAK